MSELDKRIALAIGLGDRNQLVATAWCAYRKRIEAFLLSRGATRDDAQEVIQHVFIKCFEQADKLHADTLCQWLVTLARFEFYTLRNRRNRASLGAERFRDEHGTLAASSIPPVDRGEMREAYAIVSEVERSLDPVNSLIFSVRHEEITDRQLADLVRVQLGVTIDEDSIKHRRARVLRKVTRKLRGGGYLV